MTTLPNLNLPLATVGADDDAWGVLLNAILTKLDLFVKGGAGVISGLGMSNSAGTPNTQIDVAAGICMASDNAGTISPAAGTINFATTGANGLDSGSLANNTWYHCFAIGKTDGTAAFFASTSLSPTLPTGYTLKRRIGSVKTNGSAQLVAFKQYGNRFYWVAPVSDYSTTPSDTAAYMTLTVPTGLNIRPLTRGSYRYTGATNNVTFWSPAVDDTAAVASNGCADAFIIGAGNDFSTFKIEAVTDTSARVRYKGSAAAGTLAVVTTGWVDPLGAW